MPPTAKTAIILAGVMYFMSHVQIQRQPMKRKIE